MSRNLRWFSVAVVAGAVLLTLGLQEALAQQLDQVVHARGGRETTVNGIIQEISRERLRMQQVNEQGTLIGMDYALRDVRHWTIHYRLSIRGQNMRGRAFADGRMAMLNQRWAQAIVHFSAAVAETQDEFARLIARMHLVECGLELGSSTVQVRLPDGQREMSGYAVASHFAEEFRRNHESSYYLSNVLTWAGRAQELGGDMDAAITTYRALAEMERVQGNLRLGDVYFRQRNWSQARNSFRTARDAAQSAGERAMVERCDVLIGRCGIELNDWAAARRTFEQLVGDDGSQDRGVLGAAYLGLGLCLAHDQRWEEAFMALARAATAFKAHISDADRQLALGLCVQVATELAAGNSEWQPRVERLRQEFNRQFPRTPLPEIR